MAKINGEEFSEKMTIADYLRSQSLDISRVAVMINGDILPKSEYASREIGENDEIDVVGFVGGG